VLLIVLASAAGSQYARGEDMHADWLIAPHQGIGRLTFGLSPDEVAAMAALYGEPSPLRPGSDAASATEDVIVQFGDSLSEETIAILKETMRDLETLATQNLTRDGIPILLEYRDGLLHGVAVEAGHGEAHFEGRRVFELDARDVLTLFERANEAPGRYRPTEAAFDNIAVSLFAFSIASPTGEVRPMPDSNPDFRNRSVTLRREPYRPAHERDQFVTFSFD
jgi:hypothetical protein